MRDAKVRNIARPERLEMVREADLAAAVTTRNTCISTLQRACYVYSMINAPIHLRRLAVQLRQHNLRRRRRVRHWYLGRAEA